MEDLRNSSVALFAAISQVSAWYLCALGRCVGVRQAMSLIGNARQATSEGKSGLVETRLTGPAVTALQSGECNLCNVQSGQKFYWEKVGFHDSKELATPTV